MKQTAVDYLIERTSGAIDWTDPYFQKIMKQAKDLEKQQIVDAAMFSHPFSSVSLTIEQAEYYYNQTYKP